jgi:prolyl-tRNA editing enzyme YbaK/EbsC (Cys-tRNA(Pro) deacylase)
VNYSIELDCDQVAKIVLEDLVNVRQCLKDDYQRRADGHTLAIFEHDREADLKEIKKHIKSFDRVLKYYGEDL